VAHSLSAKKRVRQNETHRARNRARKISIKDQVKSFLGALTAGDFAKAQQELSKTTQRLDKVAAKGTLHRKTASRKRSRLALRLNAARAAGATGAGTQAAKA
jgi:small subunit ribosomal protein S20